MFTGGYSVWSGEKLRSVSAGAKKFTNPEPQRGGVTFARSRSELTQSALKAAPRVSAGIAESGLREPAVMDEDCRKTISCMPAQQQYRDTHGPVSTGRFWCCLGSHRSVKPAAASVFSCAVWKSCRRGRPAAGHLASDSQGAAHLSPQASRCFRGFTRLPGGFAWITIANQSAPPRADRNWKICPRSRRRIAGGVGRGRWAGRNVGAACGERTRSN